MLTECETLVDGELRIDVSRADDDGLRLEWCGRSNHRFPAGVLTPFLREAMRRAQEAGGGIEMHFERLQFFNSSTITAIIQFMREARKKHVPVILFFDDSLEWQRLSFDALRIFE